MFRNENCSPVMAPQPHEDDPTLEEWNKSLHQYWIKNFVRTFLTLESFRLLPKLDTNFITASIVKGVSNARTTKDLKESLLYFRGLINQHRANQLTEKESDKWNQNGRNAERLLIWQLTTVTRQIEERQQHKEDPSKLQSILTDILSCLCALWGQTGCYVTSHDKKFQDLLPCLIRAWKLQLSQDDGTLPQNQKDSLSHLIRIIMILFKHRELQHVIIRSGIVPLMLQTAERLSSVDNMSKHCVPPLLHSQLSTSDHCEDEKKCEDISIELRGFAQFCFSSSSGLLEEILQLANQMTHRRDQTDQVYLYSQMHRVILACCHGGEGNEKKHTLLLETATAILWHWSASSAELSHTICSNVYIWTQLRCLWDNSGVDEDFKVRRNISAIVGTLISNCCNVESAQEVPHQVDRKRHDTSIERSTSVILEQSWLIPALLQVVGTNNNDIDYRRRCMRTIRCLAGCGWAREFLQHCSDQLDSALLEVLRMKNDEVDHETKILACQTVTDLLPTMKPHCDSASTLLGPFMDTALVEIVERMDDCTDPSYSGKLVFSAIHALSTSLLFSPWQRSAACFTEDFFEVIMGALQQHIDQSAYHKHVSDLLVHLVVREETVTIDDSTYTATKIPSISRRLTSIPTVLEILTMLLSPIANPEFDASRQNAIAVIRELVYDDERNKKKLAEDEYLLTALVNFCLMNNSERSPTKEAAKGLILELVPEL